MRVHVCVQDKIADMLARNGISDRINFFEFLKLYLEEKGAFQVKGMVGQVALRLGVSNFTIYNYLKKIRATNGTAIKDIICS